VLQVQEGPLAGFWGTTASGVDGIAVVRVKVRSRMMGTGRMIERVILRFALMNLRALWKGQPGPGWLALMLEVGLGPVFVFGKFKDRSRRLERCNVSDELRVTHESSVDTCILRSGHLQLTPSAIDSSMVPRAVSDTSSVT
jgi:hypothetical protein